MGVMEKLSVDIPADLLATVRAQVAAGRYASESEAITAALWAATADDDDLDAWLRGPVADAYDAVERGDTVLMTSEEVRAALRRRD